MIGSNKNKKQTHKMETLTEHPVQQFLQSLNSTFKGGVCSVNEREQALNDLMTLDFPTSKTEAWKYTRTTKISKQTFSFQSADIKNVNRYKISGLDADTLVFINGFYAEHHSTLAYKEGVKIVPFSQVKTQCSLQQSDDVFSKINTVFATDGICIEVLKNTVLANPIEVIHIVTGDNTTAQVRNRIVVHENAQVELIFSTYAEDAQCCFSNFQTEMEVKTNARLTVNKLQVEGGENFQISRDYVRQERDSYCMLNTLTLEGNWVRNDVVVNVDGENAETYLNGICLGSAKQHVDNHTFISHNVPNCQSFELYKSVMDEQSTAVFNGKVLVKKDAQQINAYQSNANILLSENASVNSKPELEIYADDVKCSHGSTTGQLDESALFYLRARGLSKEKAQKLLIAAFVEDVLEHISNATLKQHINQLLAKRFAWEF